MVDVIVSTYNQLSYLRQALYNIKRNTGCSCRVTVVSDGATDGTDEWMESVEAQGLFDQFIRKPNGGVSSALNCGIVNTNGSWVCTLAGDMVPPPNWLRDQMRVWESGEFDFVALGVRYIEAHLAEDGALCPYETFAGIPTKRLIPDFENPKPQLIGGREVTPELETLNGVQVLSQKPDGNVALLCHRDTYKQIGMYVEFGSYGHNDAELMFRARRMGKNRFGIVTRYVQHLWSSDPNVLRAKRVSAAINRQRILNKDYRIPSYDDCADKYKGKGAIV